MDIIKLTDKECNTYSFKEEEPFIVSTNKIYIANENPDIYIKVIKEPSLIEHPKEHEYIYNKINSELKIAKKLSDNFFPVPHVYYTQLDIGPEYITGYIVMERIKGRVIETQKELEQYFNKIMDCLNDLLGFGIIYKDMNINNFIIGDDNEIYLIDFEDVVPYEKEYRFITDNNRLNDEYIKTALEQSIIINKNTRRNDSYSFSTAGSRKNHLKKLRLRYTKKSNKKNTKKYKKSNKNRIKK